ncbi:MAG: hypothetical protein E7417_03800 [Ruminococcaceae bacterium]|nr:hypothetical protein [Oscillospiraceae bacterium]
MGREMTNEMLCEAFYLEKEIEQWKKELEKLKSASLTPQLSMENTTVKGGKIKDSTGDLASEIADLERKIRKEVYRLIRLKNRIAEYIMGIEDSQTRLIFHMRVYDLMTWNDIADKIGGMNSEDSVKKRYYRYLKKTS